MPRKIELEIKMPDDADEREWDAFVSWWNEEGCERGYLFVRDLWRDRADPEVGFDRDQWIAWRKLARHLKLVAASQNCTVGVVHHTHRRHATMYQGSHVLADNIDGVFVVERDKDRTGDPDDDGGSDE